MAGFTDDFAALPMETLIGAPLEKAAKAQTMLSQATADFINNVGFYTDANGNVLPRQANFVYYKPVEIPGNPNATPPVAPSFGVVQQTLTIPFIALVNVPALSIKTVDIVFDMEVKSSQSDSSGSSSTLSADVNAKYGTKNFGISVSIHGSVSAHQEHTRTTDKSAKYHFEIHAEDQKPEGLMRVLDILQSAMGAVASAPATAASGVLALQGSGVADTQAPPTSH